MTSFDEKTRVTQVVRPISGGGPDDGVPRTDCLVTIYTKEPTLLGKRFVLDQSPTRVGRGTDNHVVLDGDSVSRRHAQFEQKAASWLVSDLGSTNGTYCNDEQVTRPTRLVNGDRVKVGATIFKFLSGADVEAQYHEEIYRLTIIDGLTQIHNKRYLFEALERELIRGRRHGRQLAVLMFDIDHFKRINDSHGHAVGDEVLRSVAARCSEVIRDVDVLGRYGGEEFAVLLPETPLQGAVETAERLRAAIGDRGISTSVGDVAVTISAGAAELSPETVDVHALLDRADAAMLFAKRLGRNRVQAG